MTAAFERAPSPHCAIAIEDFHGAVTHVASTATAYPHRERGLNLLLIAQWIDPAQTERCIAWARETFAALSPHRAQCSSSNYLAADDQGVVRNVYGANYERLVELKRRVLGGYHLAGKALEQRIEATVRDLDERVRPRIVAPGHCTGWRAKARFAAAFAPGRHAPSAVGSSCRLTAER